MEAALCCNEADWQWLWLSGSMLLKASIAEVQLLINIC